MNVRAGPGSISSGSFEQSLLRRLLELHVLRLGRTAAVAEAARTRVHGLAARASPDQLNVSD